MGKIKTFSDYQHGRYRPPELMVFGIFRPKINGIRDTQTPPPPFMGPHYELRSYILAAN